MRVMDERLHGERIHSALLDRFVSLGVLGGQYADGSQKNGFLQYEKGQPMGVFDPDAATYAAISDFQVACDQRLGALPQSALPWKALLRHPAKGDALATYFGDLAAMDTLGAELARRYGKQSRLIARNLVADSVANSEEDVNTVLLTGFYHAYGPINDYFA
jgi:hypothetical protein